MGNTLRSELAETKRNLEKTNAKLSKSNTQLTSALQSLDEMMKYIEKMRDDNDEAVEILEQDLEKAIKMKHNTENGMKKRINALQVIEKKQYTAIQLKDEEKRKLAKELELAGESSMPWRNRTNGPC